MAPGWGKWSTAGRVAGSINTPAIVRQTQGSKSRPKSVLEIQMSIQEQQGTGLKEPYLLSVAHTGTFGGLESTLIE